MPTSPSAGSARPRPAGRAEPVRLYVHETLSVRRIAARTGLPRRRIAGELRAAGIVLPPRGTGRAKPLRRPEDAALPPDRLRALYVDQRLTARVIGRMVGMPERRVIDRLHRYAIPVRSRGAHAREDRRSVPAQTLRALYVRARLSADAIGRQAAVSRHIVLRSAHDLGLPVRTTGAGDRGAEVELVDALYADPAVTAVLRRHRIPRVPPGGPITTRFPEPVPLTDDLLRTLYTGCGLTARHIELLTGQPAETIRRALRTAGVQTRPPGGRSPFLRRVRLAPPAVTG